MWRYLAPLYGHHRKGWWWETMNTRHKQVGVKAKRQDQAMQCPANHRSCIHTHPNTSGTPVRPGLTERLADGPDCA